MQILQKILIFYTIVSFQTHAKDKKKTTDPLKIISIKSKHYGNETPFTPKQQVTLGVDLPVPIWKKESSLFEAYGLLGAEYEVYRHDPNKSKDYKYLGDSWYVGPAFYIPITKSTQMLLATSFTFDKEVSVIYRDYYIGVKQEIELLSNFYFESFYLRIRNHEGSLSYVPEIKFCKHWEHDFYLKIAIPSEISFNYKSTKYYAATGVLVDSIYSKYKDKDKVHKELGTKLLPFVTYGQHLFSEFWLESRIGFAGTEFVEQNNSGTIDKFDRFLPLSLSISLAWMN